MYQALLICSVSAYFEQMERKIIGLSSVRTFSLNADGMGVVPSGMIKKSSLVTIAMFGIIGSASCWHGSQFKV